MESILVYSVNLKVPSTPTDGVSRTILELDMDRGTNHLVSRHMEVDEPEADRQR